MIVHGWSLAFATFLAILLQPVFPTDIIVGKPIKQVAIGHFTRNKSFQSR